MQSLAILDLDFTPPLWYPSRLKLLPDPTSQIHNRFAGYVTVPRSMCLKRLKKAMSVQI